MNRILFILAFLFPALALGQGGLGDYSKDLKTKSLQSVTVTIGTGANTITLTGGTIAFGTAAVSVTGTLGGLTVSSITLAGGSATLTGILDGGTARNTVIQGASLTTTGTNSQLGYVQVGTLSMLSSGASLIYMPATSTGTPNLFSSGYYGFSGVGSSPFHGTGFFSTNLQGLLFRHSNTSFAWDGYNSGAGYSYRIMRSDGRIGFASGTDGSNGGDTMIGRSSSGVFWIGGGTPSALTGGLIAANGTLGSLSVGSGGMTLGSASTLTIAAGTIATAGSINWDFSKPINVVTGSAAMTIGVTNLAANRVSSLIIIGGSGASALTWSHPLNDPQIYVGTTSPVTALGSGHRLRLDGYSLTSGTADLIITRGP